MSCGIYFWLEIPVLPFVFVFLFINLSIFCISHYRNGSWLTIMKTEKYHFSFVSISFHPYLPGITNHHHLIVR